MPIEAKDLKVGTMYVIVFNDKKIKQTMEYRGISEGYPLFLTKDKEYALQNIEGVTYYEVGAKDIPAVGGRRSKSKRSNAKKSKPSRKNRHRK